MEVIIVGIAENAKFGAVVLTSDREAYYLDGLSTWDTWVHKKKISVTGVLRTETLKAEDLKNEKGEWNQGMEGERKILLGPHWELVNN